MDENDVLKLMELSEGYASYEAKSLKELSQLTYAAREDGVDIPYINYFGYASPVKTQKGWYSLINENNRKKLAEIKNRAMVKAAMFRGELVISCILTSRLDDDEVTESILEEYDSYTVYEKEEKRYAIAQSILYLSNNIDELYYKWDFLKYIGEC